MRKFIGRLLRFCLVMGLFVGAARLCCFGLLFAGMWSAYDADELSGAISDAEMILFGTHDYAAVCPTFFRRLNDLTLRAATPAARRQGQLDLQTTKAIVDCLSDTKASEAIVGVLIRQSSPLAFAECKGPVLLIRLMERRMLTGKVEAYLALGEEEVLARRWRRTIPLQQVISEGPGYAADRYFKKDLIVHLADGARFVLFR